MFLIIVSCLGKLELRALTPIDILDENDESKFETTNPKAKRRIYKFKNDESKSLSLFQFAVSILDLPF